jgi:hypothetical protein
VWLRNRAERRMLKGDRRIDRRGKRKDKEENY